MFWLTIKGWLWAILLLPVMGILRIFVFILELLTNKKGEDKKNAIRKSILENGRKATATIMEASTAGTRKSIEERVLMRVKFSIKFDHNGYEYPFVREYLPVPMPYVSEFKVNNSLRCTVAKHDLNLVLFEFDEKCSALDITFKDSWFS
jgi:hypothetical protein